MHAFPQSCTYDQVTFRPENNLIFDVDVACTGVISSGEEYNLRKSLYDDVNLEVERYALTELAQTFLKVGSWRDVGGHRCARV